MLCPAPKYFIFLGLLLFITLLGAAYSYAQNPETNIEGITEASKANSLESETFFNECAAAPIISMSEDTDIAFCACAASHLYSWLEAPLKQKGERAFFETITTKDLDKNTLLTKIYGPCLHIPVYDITFEGCFYDKEKRYFTSDAVKRGNMCNCIATGDSLYFKNFAVPFMELKIAEEDEIKDPIAEIKRDTNYYNAHSDLERGCYSQYSNEK